MTRPGSNLITALALLSLACFGAADVRAQDLSTFGVLAGSEITNTGSTVINGNIGVYPGSAISGFPPGTVNGTVYATNGVAQQAQSDLTTLYNVLAGRPQTQDLTGVDLGTLGGPLGPGVYNFDTSAQLTGTLTLTGNADSIFIFNIGSTLTTAANSSIVVLPPAQAGNVFFRVGSSATLGASTAFSGQIVALTAIAMQNAASINCGAALARNAEVTLINNTITVCVLDTASFEDALDDDDTTTTVTAEALADALDDFVGGGGVLPPGFAILAAALTPAELALALAELSGETASGVAPTGALAMDSFLSLLGSRFGDDGSFAGEDVPGEGTSPGRGTVRALGYMDEDSSPAGTDAAIAALNRSTPRLWNAWAAAYGGRSHVDGDIVLGTHARTSHVQGLAAGVDFRVSAATTAGFAVSGGTTSFGLSEGFGSGHGDMLQIGAHGRTNFGDAYVTGALAYGWHGVTTDRTVTVAGTDRFAAAFSAQNVAGEIEGGYRFGWVTPYAALRAQAFITPAYSETVVSGVSTFALDYDASTTTSIRTELGARVGPTIPLDDGAALALRGRVAWAHYFASGSGGTASFQSIGDGPTFGVVGAGAATDSLLLSAGAELRLKNGFSVAGLFDTELAEGSHTYTGMGRVRLTW